MRALALFGLLFFGSCGVRQEHAQIFHQLMPENDLGFDDNIEKSLGIEKADFEAICDEMQAFFAPMVKNHGAKLKIVKEWSNPTVNAYATKTGGGSVWEVHALGGLARRPEISSKDAMGAVIGHEIGHFLGGFPTYSGDGVGWASAEGESDYFAGQAAMRAIWAADPLTNELAILSIPEYPKAKCDAAWAAESDQMLCYRIMLASKSLADLLSQGQADWSSPDLSQVLETNVNHPAGQCRLDTFMAAAVCPVAFDLALIPRDEDEAYKHSCKDGDGARPRCWFKPGV